VSASCVCHVDPALVQRSQPLVSALVRAVGHAYPFLGAQPPRLGAGPPSREGLGTEGEHGQAERHEVGLGVEPGVLRGARRDELGAGADGGDLGRAGDLCSR